MAGAVLWTHVVGKHTNRNETISFERNCPFLKKVPQNCLAFDVVNFAVEEVSQNLFVWEVLVCELFLLRWVD